MASLEGEELLQDENHELQWVPLSLTHVEYPKGDWLGKIFALTSLLPCGIVSGFIALILFRRDLHTEPVISSYSICIPTAAICMFLLMSCVSLKLIVFFIGMLVNEILNFLLKNIFAEERPLQRSVNYSEYGMPSAHSQFSWFFATYVICFVCIRLHHMNNNSTLENVWKTVIVLGCVSFASVVCFSRIYLQYHTWSQVFCGAIVGILFGSLWFALTHFILTPYFPAVVSWRISEVLLIRDTTLIPNVLWFEYTNVRQEARARSRKLVSMKSQ